jgi:hypothetical protein
MGLRPRLLAWQWGVYEATHADRRNLLVHIASAPFFLLGTLAILSSPFVSPWLAPAGLFAMALVMLLQGRGHRLEAVPPSAFLGPADFVSRLIVEQWITFPRYVLSGGFGRAWKAAGTPKPNP